ncbi:hypothetical protein DPMN_058505 [Dreissena polymorpha]|uniref:Uncharacterized protein n=1 Tax=Dreissena polymorpha TaxID=45954 RepID=A0A9D4C283_DREPO|nr:hypothetical protein DPMN_058505 [Dreissena polymorpha]
MIGQKLKNAPPTGGHVFGWTETTFELNQHIIKTNILTNDLVFDPARPIFKLDRDYIGTKLLTKFHEDRIINVALRVFTHKCGRTDRQTTDKDWSQKQSVFGRTDRLTDTLTDSSPAICHPTGT